MALKLFESLFSDDDSGYDFPFLVGNKDIDDKIIRNVEDICGSVENFDVRSRFYLHILRDRIIVYEYHIRESHPKYFSVFKDVLRRIEECIEASEPMYYVTYYRYVNQWITGFHYVWYRGLVYVIPDQSSYLSYDGKEGSDVLRTVVFPFGKVFYVKGDNPPSTEEDIYAVRESLMAKYNLPLISGDYIVENDGRVIKLNDVL